jgi:tetratricopeptide (TPR) repeat protein
MAGKNQAEPPQSAGLPLEQTLDLALQHHAAGRLPNAERIYRQILQALPDHPVCLHMLGVIAHQTGKHESAVELISKALAGAPDYAEAHNNLGNVFKALGRQEDAIASFEKTVALEPGFAESHLNLGTELQNADRPEDAVASYRNALASKPDYAEAHYNLGIAFKEMGRLDDSIASYREAVAINPDFAEAHNNLGNALRQLGRLDEALASYDRALAINPKIAEIHYNLGNVLKDLDRLEDAVPRFQKAVDINPEHAAAWNNLGNACQALGRLDDAVDCFRKAVALKPGLSDAYRKLANIKKFTGQDADILAMEKAFAGPDADDAQRMHLAFGLGKAHDDQGEYYRAFEYFSTANALKRASIDFTIDHMDSYFDYLKRLFGKELFAARQGAGSSKESAIFILGMPRSGTTLIEQILASHPEIHGAGELYDLQRIIEDQFGPVGDAAFADNVNQADNARFANSGDTYVRALRGRSETARFITDKMPNNFQLIGMIKLILPNAKIIHCRRDPLDTCLSIFKNLFTSDGYYYAYDLSELGRYYSLYRDLMEHWHGLFPGSIFDIRYEDMIADQGSHTRALIEHCGLEWDDACLAFHETDRPVYTASAAQVRQPIYDASVQSWKNYEEWLGPLREAL